MTHPGVEALSVHTLRCISAPGVLATLSRVAAHLDPPEAIAPGATVAGPSAWNDAVLLFVPRGVIPALYMAAQAAATMLGFRVSIIAGALALNNLLPDQVDGAIDAIGARRWMRPITPPARLVHDNSGNETAAGRTSIRLVRPQMGRDTYWIVKTHGAAEPAIIARALQARIGAPVQASETLAYDADCRADRAAVLVRVPEGSVPLMEQLAATGTRVSVAGRAYSIAPVIAIGDRNHAIPSGTTAADLLHRAAAAAGNGPWGRGEHALVVEQRPADEAGVSS